MFPLWLRLRAGTIWWGKTEMVPPLAHEPRRQKTTSSGWRSHAHTCRTRFKLVSEATLRLRSLALADQTFPGGPRARWLRFHTLPRWEPLLLFAAVMLVHMHHQTLFKGGSWVGMIPRMGMVHKPAVGGPIRPCSGGFAASFLRRRKKGSALCWFITKEARSPTESS
jgi:hypothetical protein